MKIFRPAFDLRYLIGLALVAVLICAAPPAGAQKFLENYKQPMPSIALMPDKDFQAQTIEYADTPLGDKGLSYVFRLPPTWIKDKDVGLANDAIGTKVLDELARFYSPPRGDKRSYVSIKAVNLAYKLTAEEWLVQYLLSNSYTLQGMKTYDDSKSEALYVYVDKDITYIVRTVAIVNGKRVVLAQYYLPQDNWDSEKQLQQQVEDTFALTTPVTENIENMKKYHFLDIAEFDFPDTWESHADPLKSIERINVQLYYINSIEYRDRDVFKTLNGKIAVGLVSYYIVDNIDEEIKNFKNELQKSGLVIKDKIETHKDFQVNKNMDSRPVDVFNIIDEHDNVLNYELWLEVLQSGDYYYFVTLITPSRDADFATWARNVETYKGVVASVAPETASLTNGD